MMEVFDRKAIELNKQGKKSEAQIKEIKQMMNPGMWMYVGLGILVAGGCFSTVMSDMSFLGIVLGLCGLLAAGMGFKKWNQRRVLLAEPVQAASGTVAFKDGIYVAETSHGKRVSYLGTGGAAVPPGKYSFYFLDSNGWLLAADPRDSEEDMKARVNQILAKTFEYDMEYLEATRKDAQAGIIKSAQGIPEVSFIMESVPKTSVDSIDETITHTFYTVGGFKFKVPDSSYILSKFPHRVYYLEDKLQAIEIL